LEVISSLSEDINNLKHDIDHVTRSLSRPYFNTALNRLAIISPSNARLICNYILVEETESNIKDSTKESKIKILVWLSNFHKGKSFEDITKKDINPGDDDIWKFIDDISKWIVLKR
jgi:hypothetical protein